MARRRSCIICGELFKPHPRAGTRQKACSEECCQRERHLQNCKTWRQKNHEAEQVHKIRQKILTVLPETPVSTEYQPPRRRICWKGARQIVGLETAVLIEEMSKTTHFFRRDSVPP